MSSYADHREAEQAEFALYQDFQGLPRDTQAVLAVATLHCLRSHDCSVSLTLVGLSLGMTIDAVEDCVDELVARTLAWRVQDDAGEFKMIETAAAASLSRLAIGPGGRPNARDWRGLRAEVFAKVFGGEKPYCVYCGREGTALVLDHAIPVSRGGSNHPSNLLPACEPCNGAKRAKTFSEFLQGERETVT